MNPDAGAFPEGCLAHTCQLYVPLAPGLPPPPTHTHKNHTPLRLLLLPASTTARMGWDVMPQSVTNWAPLRAILK